MPRSRYHQDRTESSSTDHQNLALYVSSSSRSKRRSMLARPRSDVKRSRPQGDTGKVNRPPGRGLGCARSKGHVASAARILEAALAQGHRGSRVCAGGGTMMVWRQLSLTPSGRMSILLGARARGGVVALFSRRARRDPPRCGVPGFGRFQHHERPQHDR
jgi:hypothetical protein